MDVERWSGEADDNQAAVPDGAPDGWNGEDLNNWGRETMAAVRRTWQNDGLRNVVVLTGGGKAGVTRDSDIQFTIQALDRVSSFPANRRVLVGDGVGGFKWCSVVSASLVVTDTVVTVSPDPDDDGTQAALGTGLVTIDAGAGTITDDGSGTDPTPFSSFVVGDKAFITGGSVLNLGTWIANVVASNVLTVVPVGGYELRDEGPVAMTIRKIDKEGVLPVTIVDVYLEGAHQENGLSVGQDPLDIPRNEFFGDAAYKAERQLQVDRLAGETPLVAADDNRVVMVDGAATPLAHKKGPVYPVPVSGDEGKVVVVDPADFANGFVLSPFASEEVIRWKSAQQTGGATEEIITSSEYTASRPFDGAEYVRVRGVYRIRDPFGVGFNVTLRVRVGQDASRLLDPILKSRTVTVTGAYASYELDFLIQPANGDTQITFTFQGAGGLSARIDATQDDDAGPQYDFPSDGFMRVTRPFPFTAGSFP